MKNIKKIIIKQFKILLLLPILVAFFTFIFLNFSKYSQSSQKLKEAIFVWELLHLQTRGILVNEDYIINKVPIIDPVEILKTINRNIKAFISEANKKNCNLTFDDWYLGKFVIKVNSEDKKHFVLDLNEFKENDVIPCKEFMYDYIINYTSKTLNELIQSDKDEIKLLREISDTYIQSFKLNLYKNLKTTKENIELSEELIIQRIYFEYLSEIEQNILNLSSRVSRLQNIEKKLNLIHHNIIDSAKSTNLLLKIFIAYIFGLILSILFISVIEAKAIGRYFK